MEPRPNTQPQQLYAIANYHLLAALLFAAPLAVGFLLGVGWGFAVLTVDLVLASVVYAGAANRLERKP